MAISKIIARGQSKEDLSTSDAALIFTDGPPTPESITIILEAKKYQKPYLHINIRAADHESDVLQIVNWLNGKGNNTYEDYKTHPPEKCRLNVAINKGSRPSDIDSIVMQLLVEVLRQVNPECRNFLMQT